MRQVFFFTVIILMLAVLIFLVAKLPIQIVNSKDSVANIIGLNQIDYANKLLSKGLKSEAAEVFEEYLKLSRLNPQEEAKLLYKLGNIYMEVYRYEKALKNFYRSEMIEPKAEFVQEMNQKIIAALENLGMNTQARYELEERTSLGGADKEMKGKAVARIGKREISEAEIDQVTKFMPPWMKKSLEDPQARREFINEYVAQEVLYDKGKRLGLDTAEETRQTLEQVKKQIVVEQVVKKEIQEQLDKISPEDIKLYYDAHKDKYADPAQIKVSYLGFENETQKDEITQKLKNQEGKPEESWISEGQTDIAGIGEAKDIIAGLFLKEKGQISDPLKIKDKFYIFSILEKKEKRQKSFEEVKSEAEYEYKMKKQQEITQALLKKSLEEQEVDIYEQKAESQEQRDEKSQIPNPNIQ